MKRISIVITGKVQGVWYRKSTKEKADELGLSGYVQNEANGFVTAEAEGSIEQLEKLVNWCKNGPENARVLEVRVSQMEIENSSGFEIYR